MCVQRWSLAWVPGPLCFLVCVCVFARPELFALLENGTIIGTSSSSSWFCWHLTNTNRLKSWIFHISHRRVEIYERDEIWFPRGLGPLTNGQWCGQYFFWKVLFKVCWHARAHCSSTNDDGDCDDQTGQAGQQTNTQTWRLHEWMTEPSGPSSILTNTGSVLVCSLPGRPIPKSIQSKSLLESFIKRALFVLINNCMATIRWSSWVP